MPPRTMNGTINVARIIASAACLSLRTRIEQNRTEICIMIRERKDTQHASLGTDIFALEDDQAHFVSLVVYDRV